MAPARPDRRRPTAAGMEKPNLIPAGPAARLSRRPDLSAPFTVAVMTGLLSAALFLAGVIQHGVPLERVLRQAFVDPFGAMALALIAAAAVMVRIGDI
jgi:hypothetical protein